jgi:alpha-D-ribose 1-methylphosphonate 5-triphosphate synthase subunit PhnH
MPLDSVHDIQSAFRKIMRAMAYPGEVVDLGVEAGKIDLSFSFNKAVMLIALTILDAETRFAVFSDDGEGDGGLISQMTYSKTTTSEKADFLFVIGPARDARAALDEARIGSLVDPHLGATIIVEASRITGTGPLALSGPGVAGSKRIGIERDGSWVSLRERKNAEFPMGIDLIFVDPEGRLVALPRTTRIGAGA